jgi:hypothetical protein
VAASAVLPSPQSLVPSPSRLHRLDQDAPCTLLLGTTLRVGGLHAEVRQTDPILRAHEHQGSGDVSEREALDVSITIDAGEVSALRGLVADRSRDDVPKR